MIAVVTGGSGFIGRNLVQRLLAGGHVVRCLTRASGGTPPEGAATFPVSYDDPRTLLATAALDGADVVFHLAGATNAVSQAAFDRANVTSTHHLLGALAERRLRPRVVYVSSQAAGGPASSKDAAVTEADAPRPVESYGRSKLAAERLAGGYGGAMDVTILRLCSVFGPHDRAFFALFRLATLGIMPYPGVERQWMNWLHVDDAVTGIVAAARSPAAAARTFYLASPQPVQWRSIGEAIADAVGQTVVHLNVPLRVVRASSVVRDAIGRLTGSAGLLNGSKALLASQANWVCSAERARADFGFSPDRSLPDAVRDTYLWYTRHGWLPPRAGNAAN